MPSEQHAYGFDLDPFALKPDHIENGKDVYVSVRSGEPARVRLRADPETENLYRFVKIGDLSSAADEEIFNGQEICKRENCIAEVELSSGDYAVYYGGKDKKRYLHIFEYAENVKNIFYVQFGARDDPNCFEAAANGCYLRNLVEEHFNKIFSQAVVKGKFIEKNPQELGLDDTLVVDFSEEESTLSRLNDYSEMIRKSLYPEYKEAIEAYAKALEEWQRAVDAYDKMREQYDECVKTKGSYACVYDSKTFYKVQNQIEAWNAKKNRLFEFLAAV